MREAFLEAHGLTEPQSHGDLKSRIDALKRGVGGDQARPDQPSAHDPAQDIIDRMERYKREHPGQDFGRRMRR